MSDVKGWKARALAAERELEEVRKERDGLFLMREAAIEASTHAKVMEYRAKLARIRAVLDSEEK